MKGVLITVIWLLGCSYSYAQNARIGTDSIVLNNIVNIRNKKVEQLPNNAVFVINTPKSCSKCYQDVCNFYSKENMEIYIICLMPKKLTEMVSRYSYLSTLSNCVKDVYFLCTDKVINEEIERVNTMPSPQLITIKNGESKYYNYSEFLKLVY